MTMSTIVGTDAVLVSEESSVSAVSWGAIAAGGVAAAAFSLFLLQLVVGLGLVSVSPWSNSGASGTTLHIAGGIALILMAVMASAFGGYITGRLRTKWVGIRTDEVYFRDTAHGVLAWAFATVITVTVLASAATSVVSSVTQGAAQGAASNPALGSDRNAYYVDSLFRSDRLAAGNPDVGNQVTAEAGRLLARGLTPGVELTAADRTRLGQLVAARTGLPQADAERRVTEVIVQAKMAADEARKAAAKLAFWMAASLLAGALAAGLAAIEGGRERDD
jgi:hypothetical protein